MPITNKVRGKVNSPILVVGDSLPDNDNTKQNLSEILDRNHETYNSIILPIKYYLNEYLVSNKGYKLPSDFKNKEDIFRYVNAVENYSEKWNLDPKSTNGVDYLNVLKSEVFNVEEKVRYPIILCMGDFAYFAVRSLFDLYKVHERHTYVSESSNVRYSIERLGTYFWKEYNRFKDETKWPLILPILHNSSNLQFDKTKQFIPSELQNEYISYFEFIAEYVGNILYDNFRDYLVEIKVVKKNKQILNRLLRKLMHYRNYCKRYLV